MENISKRLQNREKQDFSYPKDHIFGLSQPTDRFYGNAQEGKRDQ